jgi:hypothetical protein
MWRNKMSTKLKDLLLEETERRVSLVALESHLAELSTKLSEADQKKLAGALIELQMLVTSLNETPYTIFNHDHWKLLKMVLAGKVAELRLVAEDIAEDNKEVDFFPLMKIIDSILTY